jgi:hypothetical protein
VYTAAAAAAVVHAVLLFIAFTLFVTTSPVPVTWTTPDDVIGQSFVMVSGPFNVKSPTSNEKSVWATDVSGLFDQHKRYRLPDVPCVVWLVATAYTS